MQENLSKLQAHVTALMPVLNANLSAAYAEWMSGKIARGAYEYCLSRHATAAALTGPLPAEVTADAAFAAGAQLFLDLRTGLKDIPEAERAPAQTEIDAMLALYREQGFTETSFGMRVPRKPAAAATPA